MAKHNLGMVTAYAYAVAGGYTGTEAEFEALLGNIATDLEEIENLTVTAETLPEGSSATASYSDGVLTLGIPKGDTGATGAGATATAGTTTTGAPGSDASVVNSGTTKDAVFDFTIPRGNTGNGIESITLTSTVGAVHTYTITFTDGDTTTFEVTDGEVTTAALTAILADYAKTDGAYESMTVGNAEQLISSVYVTDEEPYNFRTSGGSIDIGDRETDMLIGGSVAWNQLVTNPSLSSSCVLTNGTTSYSDGVLTGTADGGSNSYYSIVAKGVPANHVLLMACDVKLDSNNSGDYTTGILMTTWSGGNRGVSLPTKGTWGKVSTIVKPTAVGGFLYFYCFGSDATPSGEKSQIRNPLYIDLTQMFGSTIADYIYSLETANTGAGVAWFKKLFPKPYYAYNAGELMSVQASSHDMVGFNAWDEVTELGYINNSTGENVASTTQIRGKNYIPVIPNTTYYFKSPTGLFVYFYDANKEYIGVHGSGTRITNNTITLGADVHYIRVSMPSDYGTTYNHDICINLSWDGERDGEYEAYVKHSYPLDSSLTLRGIPKLDNGNLYYDGDVYEPDGTVTRKYGIVDLGTLTWSKISTTGDHWRFYATYDDAKAVANAVTGNLMCEKYEATTALESYGGQRGVAVQPNGTHTVLMVVDENYSDQTAFKTAMSGVYLVYELATPTTETADPYTNPQIVDDFGTEEYVDYAVSQGSRDVEIPVGHETQYMPNLKAKLEMAPNSPDGDGDYIVRQTNGENEYVSLASNATIQDIIARLEALEGGGE